MTAAVDLVPAAARPGRRTHTDPRPPHLVPVPDSEPPLDHEIAATAAGFTPDATAPTRRSPTQTPAGPVRHDRGAIAPPSATSGGRLPTTRVGPAVGTRPAPALRPPPRPHPRQGWAPADGRAPLPAMPACTPAPRRLPTRPRVISADAVPGWSREKDVGVRMTTTADLPPAPASGTALVRALLEALTGSRPIEQLRAHCAPNVFAGLQDAPMLGRRGTTRLLSTWVCEPADGVAELSAVFRCSDRVRAMALRLQGVDGRWRVTALHLG